MNENLKSLKSLCESISTEELRSIILSYFKDIEHDYCTLSDGTMLSSIDYDDERTYPTLFEIRSSSGTVFDGSLEDLIQYMENHNLTFDHQDNVYNSRTYGDNYHMVYNRSLV